MMGLVLTALLWWDCQARPRLGWPCLRALRAVVRQSPDDGAAGADDRALHCHVAGGVRLLFSRRVILLAAVTAAAGACQDLWNASYLWHLPDPPATFQAMAKAFWFDVTKSDWREIMVMAVHEICAETSRRDVSVRRHAADRSARHRAGWRWPALAADAAAWRCSWHAWLTAFLFVYTYNVGDTHVFFLPSHQMVMLACACGAAPAGVRASHRAVCAAWVLPVTAALICVSVVAGVGHLAGCRPARGSRPEDWLTAVARRLGPPDCCSPT